MASGIDALSGQGELKPGQIGGNPFATTEEQFLKLLVAQISQQDPFNPMNDRDLITQLAQFSSVEQAMETNRRLAALQGMTATQDRNNLAALIGKQVSASGDVLHVAGHREGETIELPLELMRPAQDVTVRIVDRQGNLVRTLHFGPQDAGTHPLSWDGRTDDKRVIPDGDYRVAVEAVDANNGPVVAQPRVSGVVSGVAFDEGGAAILVGNRRIRPQDVLQITTP
jgi:flagellar basal-body rod modification protein FlgD